METKFFLAPIKSKYLKAYQLFKEFYIKENQILPEVYEHNFNICHTEFSFINIQGYLNLFFDCNEIIVTVECVNGNKFRWKSIIYIDGEKIESDIYHSRIDCLTIAYARAFQFLDTRLNIKYVLNNRFIDDSSDSSPIRINWKHMSDVLMAKRKKENCI